MSPTELKSGGAGAYGEVDVVDGGLAAEALGEIADFKHWWSLRSREETARPRQAQITTHGSRTGAKLGNVAAMAKRGGRWVM